MIKKYIIIILGMGISGFLLVITIALLSHFFLNSSRIDKYQTPSTSAKQLPIKSRPIKLNPLKISRKTPAFTTPPSPTIIIPEAIANPAPTDDIGEWGVAQQISEHTWTMKIQQDDRMTTPEELFAALNNYRQTKGVNHLQYDARLARYAQIRVDYFVTLGKTDEHQGFNEFLQDDENFKNLGFASLGENSSWGYQMTSVHLIEWIYAADQPHDNNQLDPDWTQVGIGINGNASDLIFGGNALPLN